MAGDQISATFLPSAGSDHWPVSMEWDIAQGNPRRPFRFEKFWLMQPGFGDTLRQWWQEMEPGRGTCMYNFQQKLKTLKGRIKCWNKDSFGDIFKEKQQLDLRIKDVQLEMHRVGHTTDLKSQEWTLLQELNLKEKQEEALYQQKSRNHWLRDGDRNTKFFHRAAIQHRQNNHISRLKRADGSVARTQPELEATLTDHFAELLEEPDVDRRQAQAKVFGHIPRLITPEHNHILMSPITMMELEDAVKQMAKDTAPGPDGFMTHFYRRCWETTQRS